MRAKFHIAGLLDAHAVRGMVESHPRLRRFRENLRRRPGGGDSHAHALAEHVLRRVVGDVGDLHMNNVVERLGRIDQIREKIDIAMDSVLDGHGLPKEVTPDSLETHFANLQKEMNELTQPRDALVGDGPLKITDSVADYGNTLLAEFDTTLGGSRQRGEFGVPYHAVTERFNALPEGQKALIRRAAETAPDDVARAITGEQHQQSAAIELMRQKLGSKMTDAEFGQMVEGLQDLGRARTRAYLVDPIKLQGRLRSIKNAELRAVIRAGDPWVVQSLAIISPHQLEALWDAHVARGGDANGFRGYVRGEIISYARSVFGEHTAAHGSPEIEFVLKGPDFSTRTPGTDLVGLGHDGWIWILEDKSHRAPTAHSASAIFQNLVDNLDADAKAFRARQMELQTEVPGYKPDARVTDGIQHMQGAANDLRAHLNSLPEAERMSPQSLAKMRGILDQHRIKLRVTSGFGEVTAITQDLARLGIRVKSTGAHVPLPH